MLPAAGAIAKGLLARAGNTAAEMMKRAASGSNKNKNSKQTESANNTTGESTLCFCSRLKSLISKVVTVICLTD